MCHLLALRVWASFLITSNLDINICAKHKLNSAHERKCYRLPKVINITKTFPQRNSNSSMFKIIYVVKRVGRDLVRP